MGKLSENAKALRDLDLAARGVALAMEGFQKAWAAFKMAQNDASALASSDQIAEALRSSLTFEDLATLRAFGQDGISALNAGPWGERIRSNFSIDALESYDVLMRLWRFATKEERDALRRIVEEAEAKERKEVLGIQRVVDENGLPQERKLDPTPNKAFPKVEKRKRAPNGSCIPVEECPHEAANVYHSKSGQFTCRKCRSYFVKSLNHWRNIETGKTAPGSRPV